MRSTGAMNSGRFSRLLLATTLRLATILISGCATANLNPSNDGAALSEASVLLERVPSKDVVVSDVYAIRDGDELIVYGKVKRTPDNCCDAARGHVDIEVVGPDGAIVDLVSVPYSPRNIPKVRTRSSRFSARLPYVVPQDVPLRITYRNDDEHTSAVDLADYVARRSHLSNAKGKS